MRRLFILLPLVAGPAVASGSSQEVFAEPTRDYQSCVIAGSARLEKSGEAADVVVRAAVAACEEAEANLRAALLRVYSQDGAESYIRQVRDNVSRHLLAVIVEDRAKRAGR